MAKLSLVTFIFLGILLKFSFARVVCYFPSWAKYKPGDEKYSVFNVDPTICTHIIYANIAINENGEIIEYDDWLQTVEEFDTLSNYKERNPDLKILVSLGGWGEASSIFSQVAADQEKRQQLFRDIYMTLGKYGADGLDIDWEYPGQRGGDAENDHKNLVTLLSELKSSLVGEIGMIFSLTVTADQKSMEISYPDAKALSDNVHLINVLPYNGTFEETFAEHQELDIVTGIKRWVDGGADPAKLNLGVNTYGRIFNSDETEGEIIGFNKICQLGSEWEESWDDSNQTPVKTNGTHRIIYENIESLEIKADFIKDLNIGGAAVWSLDTDDFHANCGPFYPLINAIKNRAN